MHDGMYDVEGEPPDAAGSNQPADAQMVELRPGQTLPELVGSKEISVRAKVTRRAVSLWAQRHPDFPTPVAPLACGPVYWWPHVETWLRATNRLRKGT